MEIERKFLVKNDQWTLLIKSQLIIEQYYLTKKDSLWEVRVRKTIENNQVLWQLTLKKYISTVSREEIEKEITPEEGEILIKDCLDKVKKTRFILKDSDFTIDCYPNGLITSEIEINNEDQVIEFPSFIGEEITGNKIYSNRNLVEKG